MSFKFNISTFDKIVHKLSNDYTVYSPVRNKGEGSFSDTDLVSYKTVNSAYDIVTDEKTKYSPKEVIFPINKTLFFFTEDEYREPKISEKKILIFLRACDIHGFSRLDQIFLKNSNCEDYYYKRIRDRVSFVLLECRESFDNCFCTSMGCNTTDNYSFSIRVDGNNVSVENKDTDFDKYFEEYDNNSSFKPEQVTIDRESLNLSHLNEISINTLYDNKFWEEYKSRCIGCGRCNTTCITCSCHSTYDIYNDDNSAVGERKRTWASCQIDGFTKMAGDITFRNDYGTRMRYKVLHKILDFKKRYGVNMCVGCGRCDDNCPEYISFLNCLKKLSKLQEINNV